MKALRNDNKAGNRELREARNASLHFLAAVFGFSIFVNLLMLTGPLFMLQIYDRVLGSGSEETLVALFLLVGGLYALMALLDFARGRLMARFGARFQESMDGRVFSAVISRSINADPQKPLGNELRDIESLQSFFSSSVILALCDIPWSPIFFAAIFIFHPSLGWLGVAGGAILLTVTLINQWSTRRKTKEAAQTSTQAHSFSTQSQKSSELILSQGMLPDVLKRWVSYRRNALDHSMRSNDLGGAFSTLSKSFRLFLQSAMLAFGAYLVLKGDLTGGAIIAGSILLGRALQPIEQTLSGWSQFQRAIDSWQSLSTLLTEVPVTKEKHGLTRPKAHLSVVGVTVIPPAGDVATLQQISFEVAPGEALGLIGNSGSGKSTMARAITGLWPTTLGEIRFGGATIEQYDQVTLGKLIGYLPQNITLFQGTIAENIARMSDKPDDSAVEEAAQKAHAHDLITSLPQGYNTLLDGGDGMLSGGQRQRIALARAFYGNPSLLILDEPNSALDSEGSEALNKAIIDMKAENKAVIVMTHRPMAISQCDTLVVLKQGLIRAHGPRNEVLQRLVKNVPQIHQAENQKEAF
ncbi:type I secretion system permease/ATPase [Rhodobacteraceae bacterium Araon29]